MSWPLNVSVTFFTVPFSDDHTTPGLNEFLSHMTLFPTAVLPILVRLIFISPPGLSDHWDSIVLYGAAHNGFSLMSGADQALNQYWMDGWMACNTSTP